MPAKTTPKGKKLQLKQKKEFSFPFEKINYIIIGIGIVVLVIGYFCLAQDSVDGFMPMVVAPILLVLGYCVIIPYGILKKPHKEVAAETPETAQSTQASTASQMSSNIKTKS
jgi:flagellar basal body-associated protein FliL